MVAPALPVPLNLKIIRDPSVKMILNPCQHKIDENYSRADTDAVTC